MWSRTGTVAFFLALALSAAPPQTPAKKAAPAPPASRPSAGEKSALNKEYLAGYLRHLYLWPAEVKVEIGDFKPSAVGGLLETTVLATFGQASDQMVFYVSKDGKHIFNGKVFAAADTPFREELSKITTALQPSFGAAGAQVTIVAFSDFQCPYCREEAKVLRENIVKTYPTQVRVYFKDMPLANHDWARPAAIAGRCFFRQNQQLFWEYHDWAFDKQSEINAANFRQKVAEFIKGKQVDPLQLNRCLDQRETEEEVTKSIAEARSLRVNSTPTVFINGRRLGGTPWPNLKQIIDAELNYQKTAAAASEECCEVKLPSLVPAGPNP
jgi:protein-disulfide isomerase